MRRAQATGPRPFEVTSKQSAAQGHGTRLSATATGAVMPASAIVEQLGSHFVTDPDFNIELNGKAVELTDLSDLCEKRTIEVPNVGTLTISRFDTERSGKSSKPHGIAWWVNRRLVGRPGWNALVDSRRSVAKRFTYIVEANQLAKQVKADWSDFRGVREAVWKGRPDHAFRKGFKSGLLNLRAQEDAIDFLQGHSLGSGSARGRYIDPAMLRLPEVVALIPKIGATSTNVVALPKPTLA